MRCAPTALARLHDPAARARETLEVARITHFDPRCGESCLWLNAALTALVLGRSPSEALAAATDDLRRERAALGRAEAGERDVLAWVSRARGLGSDELDTSGYTLATAQVGAWALERAESFETGLVAVVNQGGDADTTGAVAGALLGARFGLSAIPARWLEPLRPRARWRRSPAGARARGRVDRGPAPHVHLRSLRSGPLTRVRARGPGVRPRLVLA
jgi:ADP-ribosylglycohydrolase